MRRVAQVVVALAVAVAPTLISIPPAHAGVMEEAEFCMNVAGKMLESGADIGTTMTVLNGCLSG